MKENIKKLKKEVYRRDQLFDNYIFYCVFPDVPEHEQCRWIVIR